MIRIIDSINKFRFNVVYIIYEIEIRGCSIEAVDRVLEEARKQLSETKHAHLAKHLNCVIADYFLWGFRREKAEEMEKYPYHKVRSIYY